ncbi:MAG: hypothetical protein M3Y28_11720 [Armatimonadota bacterium]|nr:hypothetical protein [Armatimonadota bacterium]
MARFALVLLAALAISGLTLAHWYWLALTVGVVAGAIFFLQGMAADGSVGNARHLGQGKADVSTRLGICLAAMGIASAAVGNDHYPMSFRVFYGVCLVGAALLALFLAARTISKK